MAITAKSQVCCKVTHTENGRTTTRRIHSMMIQAADGRVHQLEGKSLPDSIALYSGHPYRGAHLAEVLLNPKDAKATPVLPAATGLLTKRDAFYVVLGMFFLSLIQILSELTAHALT